MNSGIFNKLIIAIVICTFTCGCSQPSKCDCKAELEKSMKETVLTGRAVVSDLNKKCDEIYVGAEPYMNEPCSGK